MQAYYCSGEKADVLHAIGTFADSHRSDEGGRERKKGSTILRDKRPSVSILGWRKGRGKANSRKIFLRQRPILLLVDLENS